MSDTTSSRSPAMSTAENEGRPANIMLKGMTQSGKTMMVEVLAVLWAEKMATPPMPIFTLSGRRCH
jgi:hypothetical protein